MNKIAQLITFSGLILLSLAGCKKGENDPFFSLRSRKARLAGEWTLSTLESAQVNTSGSTTNSTVSSYASGSETSSNTVVVSGNTVSSTVNTVAYTLTLTLEKDGTFKQIRTEGNATTTTEGTWIFLKKNKENELKNKEAILLTTQKITTSAGTTTMEGISGDVYVIDQLKNKEMKWKLNKKTTEGNDSEMLEMSLVFVQD